ncbi:MAG TPA: AsnC family transcriptional regulator [Thermoplasmata archaeon]|nr:AsnC family transcriptional regulator [Thermoplasmata archaeon]
MDALDIRIVRELTQGQSVTPARPGILASHRQLARVLGVSGGTVRNRVKEMTGTGFLQGMVSYVNPSALGLEAVAYTIEVGAGVSKPTVIERISRLDGVIFFENFRGSLLGIGVLYEDDAGRKRTLERIDRIARSTPVLYSRVRFPPCSDALTALDWGTVRGLMAGNLRGHAALARELKVSVRTVKRRVARLIEIGAIFTFPRMDYRKVSGGVTAELLVTFRDPSTKSEVVPRILRLLEEHLTFVGSWEEFDMYRVILPNVPVLDLLAKEVGKLSGVRSVRGELVDEVLDRFDSLRPYLERHLATPGTGGTATLAA